MKGRGQFSVLEFSTQNATKYSEKQNLKLIKFLQRLPADDWNQTSFNQTSNNS